MIHFYQIRDQPVQRLVKNEAETATDRGAQGDVGVGTGASFLPSAQPAYPTFRPQKSPKTEMGGLEKREKLKAAGDWGVVLLVIHL